MHHKRRVIKHLRKKIKRLTSAQKKIVWSGPHSNASAGWYSTGRPNKPLVVE